MLTLKKTYVSRNGAPFLNRVDPTIFQRTYFTNCMSCGFCNDICCSYGVDVDVENHARILAVADELEPVVGVPRAEWFTGNWSADAEFPGGSNTRTAVVNGRCVFLNRKGRGCLLHSWSVGKGRDYHDIKPLVSSLYPVTFVGGLLRPSAEVIENELVCLDQGPSLYEGVREELLYYFGQPLIDDLDGLATPYAKRPPTS